MCQSKIDPPSVIMDGEKRDNFHYRKIKDKPPMGGGKAVLDFSVISVDYSGVGLSAQIWGRQPLTEYDVVV